MGEQKQCSGKYARKEENTEDKESISEKRGLKAGFYKGHENFSLI